MQLDKNGDIIDIGYLNDKDTVIFKPEFSKDTEEKLKKTTRTYSKRIYK